MGLRRRLLDKGKKVVLNPQVMRVLSDDRVMKAAEGVMDARTRVRAAWKILLSGHELPPIDPALIEDLGEDEDGTSVAPRAPKDERSLVRGGE